jgi:hypothetical protein
VNLFWLIDYINQRILQAFPSMGLLKIFSYSGKYLGEIKWNKKIFFIHSGDFWLKENKNFVRFKNTDKSYTRTKVKIPSVDGYFIGVDSEGKFYFIGGGKFQSLKIYRIK